jgi:Tol biopolymer transport system component/DNA-binding winged helix-turn-helix (wHTH) protein
MTDRLGSPPAVLRVRGIEVDVRTGTLRRDGQRITLSDQPLHLLTALLERPGELVTRDELRHRLWPADTYVDFEHGLNAAVKRLRDALGDSAEAPVFIETVPRRGYRFLAHVEPTNAGGASQSTDRAGAQAASPGPGADTPTPILARGPRAMIAAGAVLVGLLAATGTWLAWTRLRQPPSMTQPARDAVPQPNRLTFGAGLQIDPTWSADGHWIAYASDAAGNFDIWAQPVDGGPPTRLTSSPEPDVQPASSPTGDRIVFRSEREGGGLYVVSAHGGPARRLTSGGVQPAWLADGQRLVYLDGRSAFVVSADGDRPPRVVLADFMRDGSWTTLAPHPDGRVTIVGVHREYRFGIFTLGIDGTNLTIVQPRLAGWQGPLGIDRLQWDPSATALYLDILTQGVSTLWKVATPGGIPDWKSASRLTDGITHAVSPAISGDGRQLAFTNQRRLVRAWLVPFDTRASRQLGSGKPVSDEDLSIASLSAARDGQIISYTGTRTGSEISDAFATSVTDRTTRLLAHNVLTLRFARDRKRLAYLLARGPETPVLHQEDNALAVRDDGGAERLVSRWTSEMAMLPSDWTPDGSRILGSYVRPPFIGESVIGTWPSTHMAERPDRVLLEARGRRLWQATYSPNGRWITFVAEMRPPGTEVEMFLAPASGAPEADWVRLATDHAWPDKPRWAPDGRTLYFISQKPGGYYNVWALPMDSIGGKPNGTPFQVTHFDSPALMIDPNMSKSEIDVTRDYLVLTMVSASGSVWSIPVTR